jgi:hypothetical protein
MIIFIVVDQHSFSLKAREETWFFFLIHMYVNYKIARH